MTTTPMSLEQIRQVCERMDPGEQEVFICANYVTPMERRRLEDNVNEALTQSVAKVEVILDPNDHVTIMVICEAA